MSNDAATGSATAGNDVPGQRGTGRLYVLPGTVTGFRQPVYLGNGLGGYDLAG